MDFLLPFIITASIASVILITVLVLCGLLIKKQRKKMKETKRRSELLDVELSDSDIICHCSEKHSQFLEQAMAYCTQEQIADLKASLMHPHLLEYGVFDKAGGVIDVGFDSGVQMSIPPGSMGGRHLIYIIVHYEDVSMDTVHSNFSAVIECGPCGLCFKKSVELNFPHCASGTEVKTATKRSSGSAWHFNDPLSPTIKALTIDSVQLYLKKLCTIKLALPLEQPHKDSKQIVDKVPGEGPAKKLKFAIFSNENYSRISFTLDNHKLLENFIEETQTKAEGLKQVSDWQIVNYNITNPSNLIIQPKGNAQRRLISRRSEVYSFAMQRVLQATYDYMDFEIADPNLLVEVFQNSSSPEETRAVLQCKESSR